MSDWSQHNLDELIFDHLEGNLSPEDSLLLENKMASDPLVRAEVEAWKGSYVSAGAVSFPAAASLMNGGGGGVFNALWQKPLLWGSSLGQIALVTAVSLTLVLAYVVLPKRAPGEKVTVPVLLDSLRQEETKLPESEEQGDSLKVELEKTPIQTEAIHDNKAPGNGVSIRSVETRPPDPLAKPPVVETEERFLKKEVLELKASPLQRLPLLSQEQIPGRQFSMDSLLKEIERNLKNRKIIKAQPLKNEGF